MPVNPTQSVRKLIAFRRTKFAEIDRFRDAMKIDSESEAIRRLVDAGLALYQRNKPPPKRPGE